MIERKDKCRIETKRLSFALLTDTQLGEVRMRAGTKKEPEGSFY